VNSRPPRLICRVVRATHADLCLDGAPSSWAARHVAGCADCTAYYEGAQELEQALKRDAVAMRIHSPDLDRCITAALQAERNKDSRSVRATRHRSPAGAIIVSAGALAVCAVGVALFVSPPKSGAPEVAQAVTSAEVNETMAAARQLGHRVWSRVQPGALVLEETQSLQHELDRVYADATTALNFLAANFLPSGSTESSPQTRPEEQRG
jgi:hypothetical protein